MNCKYKNPLQSNKSIASCLRQLKACIHTQRHHQYTSFGEFRRCETSGSDQKWEKLSQPKTYQSLFGPKLLRAHHFFTTQIYQSKKPNKELIYSFQKKNKNPIQKTTKYSETHLQKPHLWVCMELLRAWVLSFVVVVVVVLDSNTKDCNEMWMKASEREVLS